MSKPPSQEIPFEIENVTAPEPGPPLISVEGPSGSGKTYSGCLLARGMVGPDGIFGVIDTEPPRAKEYLGADPIGSALYVPLKPPFEASRFIAACEFLKSKGAQAIVVDNASDEYQGEGGQLDYHEEIHSELFDKWKKDPGLTAWVKPKRETKRWAAYLQRAGIPIILSLIQDEMTETVMDKGKMKPTGRKVFDTKIDNRIIRAMVLRLEFGGEINQRGIPRYIKFPFTRENMIRPGEQITVEHGALMVGKEFAAKPKAAPKTAKPKAAPDQGNQAEQEAAEKARQDQELAVAEVFKRIQSYQIMEAGFIQAFEKLRGPKKPLPKGGWKTLPAAALRGLLQQANWQKLVDAYFELVEGDA